MNNLTRIVLWEQLSFLSPGTNSHTVDSSLQTHFESPWAY